MSAVQLLVLLSALQRSHYALLALDLGSQTPTNVSEWWRVIHILDTTASALSHTRTLR